MRTMHEKAVAKDIRQPDLSANESRATGNAMMRYRSAMAGIVRSMGVYGPAVEDVVHDAFEAACRKADGERPDPKDEGRFLSWLCTLAKFAALTTRNDSARSREISAPTEELDDVPEPHRAYIGRYDDKLAASVVLSQMSDDDRALIHQHFFEDKTVQELAEERGVPWTTMRSRIDGVIHRARSILDDKDDKDDKAVRRRGLRAGVFAAIALRFSEIREGLQLSWSRSKHSLAVGLIGLATCGLMVAALVQSKASPPPSGYAVFGGIFTETRPAGVVAPATHVAGAGIPSGVVHGAVSLTLVTTSPDKPNSSPKSRLAGAVGDEFRDRAIVPWSVSAALRDGARKAK